MIVHIDFHDNCTNMIASVNTKIETQIGRSSPKHFRITKKQ